MAKTILSKGIDVSNAGQGKIADWSKAAKSIDCAIFKCGCGSDSTSQDDAQFSTNAAACQKKSVPFSVYWYRYATTAAKTKSEAAHALRFPRG